MFGDKNAYYFQNFASARRIRIRITKPKDDHDVWTEGTAYLNPHISQYFAGLFSTEIEEPDYAFMDKVQSRVTNEMPSSLRNAGIF